MLDEKNKVSLRRVKVGATDGKRVGPYLVSHQAEVKAIDGHAFVQFPFFVGKAARDVEVDDFLPVGDPFEERVGCLDFREEDHLVVSGENADEDDLCLGCALLAFLSDRFDSLGDLFGRIGIGEVVGSREHNNDLWCHPVEFAMSDAPKDVLGFVSTPAETACVPPEEILILVLQIDLPFGVARAPSPRNGIAQEVEIDPTGFRFLNQFFVGFEGVRVAPGSRGAKGG